MYLKTGSPACAMGRQRFSDALKRCVIDLSAVISELYVVPDRRDVSAAAGPRHGPSEPGGVNDSTAEL